MEISIQLAMQTFIMAKEIIINTDELLYVTKAKSKPVYIACFKSSALTIGVQSDNDNNRLFLTPAEYQDFLSNLSQYQTQHNQ